MSKKNNFDILMVKGKLGNLRDWMKKHHFPPRLLFFIMGITSTVWFLIRVIPKPSRAGYPCMKAAAPFMSGLIVYLLSLGGLTIALQKAKQNIYRARYVTAGSFILVAFVSLFISLTQGTFYLSAGNPESFGPEDGPNQPIGKPLGINPGRVVWVWNPDATNENCVSNFDAQDWYFKPQNTNSEVVGKMVINSIYKLTGKTNLKDSWDLLFRYQNNKKHKVNKGYTKGEKIFIKINQGTSRWLLTRSDKDNGCFYPAILNTDIERRRAGMGATETEPYIVLELLRELVNEFGVDQKDISVGDPMADIYGHNYAAWVAEFPYVAYIDKLSTIPGRTLIATTSDDLLFYSDKKQRDKLYNVIENAEYLINVANLKPHVSAGISLTAKNHFGSQGSPTAGHLHYALMMPRGGVPMNGGYHKYRVLVDLMGSKYLGQNTMLYIVDGLFGGGASETRIPVRYFMAPFNNDWCNSIFVSQDQVALESVCFDFLRTEWNGVNKHDPLNNLPETGPNMFGVDDYLHQAADSSNWPAGILYNPDNGDKPISSLGVHEHWNNPEKKQYSRNLGFSYGIELVSVPDTLVKNMVSSKKSNTTISSSDSHSLKAKKNTGSVASAKNSASAEKRNTINSKSDKDSASKAFYSVFVDENNTKWFLTTNGMVSFDGRKWILHNKNPEIPIKNLRGFAYESSSSGSAIYLASPDGVTKTKLPINANTRITKFDTSSTAILSNDVRAVAIGKNSIDWVGTIKGISAFRKDKWLTNSYSELYPVELFDFAPITTMATSPGGDTLYAATKGVGVVRVYRNDVDGITGASEYAPWGPILIPSENVFSIFITPDRVQWFGTDQGVARHTGNDTMKNWTVFTTKEGLVNNFVLAIATDKEGKMWFGTKGGVSVFDGSAWKSHTEADGLNSNNILCIAVDKEGIVWLGSDNGVNSYNKGKFKSFE